MNKLQVKILLIFLLLSITIKAGPAYPACAALCALQCSPVVLGYPICLAACLALCAGSCFEPNQIVECYKNNSWQSIPLSKIQKGDLIRDYNGFTQVVSKGIISEKTIFQELLFKNDFTGMTSKITVTDTHPMLTNGRWKKVGQLNIGEEFGFEFGKQVLIAKENKQAIERIFLLTKSGSFVVNGKTFGAFTFEENADLMKSYENWRDVQINSTQ